jgi:5-formaminoimidazole-4-carboxamide-1-(beta)-D-ribofuranosyl 5'-monophosphate synthetase
MPLSRARIQEIVSSYATDRISIGIFGSHSALELGMSARAMGAQTVVVVQKGRDALYQLDHAHLYDYVIVVDKFQDMLRPSIQKELQSLNTIFVPNRSFSVYVGYDGIENSLQLPLYGNRFMLRCEDRHDEKGQYYLLKKAGIRVPREFTTPKEIDRLAIVKVQRADNPLERAFFYPSSPDDYFTKAQQYLEKGLINKKGLAQARIEEYVLGARFNANFHHYALTDVFGSLDFVGLSDRRQINLQGFLNLPAREQLQIQVPITNEEIGHYGLTIRESKQPLLWSAACKFVEVAETEYPPGVIGMFGLQGAIAYSPHNPKALEFVVFDLSPRIPGDPAIGPTSPEMRNLSLKHKKRIEDPLDLTIMELQRAASLNRLQEVVT